MNLMSRNAAAPLSRRARATCATAAIAALAIAACSSDGDPVALATIEAAVPDPSAGDLYVVTTSDGACGTDCPPPGFSRGWVIDCDKVDDVRADFVERLISAGFEDADGDAFVTTGEGVVIDVTLSVYDDASTGPQPTEEPYRSGPASLEQACSLFVLATGSS